MWHVTPSIEGNVILTDEERADLFCCDDCNASTVNRSSRYVAYKDHLWIICYIFCQIPNFMRTCLAFLQLFHADRKTVTYGDANGQFHNNLFRTHQNLRINISNYLNISILFYALMSEINFCWQERIKIWKTIFFHFVNLSTRVQCDYILNEHHLDSMEKNTVHKIKSNERRGEGR
jgi:hypothetical protein